MLKLSTHLNIETIKKSKKLQGIECDYCSNVKYCNTFTHKSECSYNFECGKYFPAPTIADIIDNAEELFGDEYICEECFEVFTKDCDECNWKKPDEIKKYEHICKRILRMCQQDKPLKEIEECIIKNIKE